MTSTVRAGTQGRSRFLVAVVFFVFFEISFLTNILGPLVPDIIADFHVSLTMAAILPFAFFIAYGVMSIPAGFAVQRWGEKKPMVASFIAASVGATSFAAFLWNLFLYITFGFVLSVGVWARPLIRNATRGARTELRSSVIDA
jgi:fucose permease